MEMLVNNSSLDITLHQMSELVDHCRRWNIHQPLFFLSRHFTLSNYDTMYINMTNEIYNQAKHNVLADFDAVGVMEDMGSYFVLVAKVYNYDVSRACGIHLDHGSSTEYQSLYGTNTRPAATELFQPEILDFFRTEVFPLDIAFFEFIRERHT